MHSVAQVTTHQLSHQLTLLSSGCRCRALRCRRARFVKSLITAAITTINNRLCWNSIVYTAYIECTLYIESLLYVCCLLSDVQCCGMNFPYRYLIFMIQISMYVFNIHDNMLYSLMLTHMPYEVWSINGWICPILPLRFVIRQHLFFFLEEQHSHVLIQLFTTLAQSKDTKQKAVTEILFFSP